MEFFTFLRSIEKFLKEEVLILVLDRNYTILYVSSNVSLHIKYSEKELVGKSFFSLIDPIDEPLVTRSISFDTNEVQKLDLIQMRCSDSSMVSFSAYFHKMPSIADEDDSIIALLNNKSVFKADSEVITSHLLQAIQFNESAYGIFQSDGKILYANYALLRWYELTDAEMKALHFYEIDSDIDNPEKWELLKKNIRVHDQWNEELRLTMTSGETIDVERRWYALTREKELYLVIMIPIKARKETEKKIHKTLERQHILSQIAFILNTHENFEYKVSESLRLMGNYLQVDRIVIFQNILSNKAASCTFEWHTDEILPRRYDLQAIPYSLLPEISKQLLENSIAIYEGIGNIPLEIIPYFQPYEIYALMCVSLKFSKQDSFGFLIIVDHHKTHNWKENDRRFVQTFCEILSSSFRLKQNVEQLIKSERRFREMAELLPEMICEAAINGKVIFANKHTQIQFGFTENDLSKGIIFFNFFHPKYRERVLENFEKLLSGEHIKNEEYIIINREKQEIPVLLYMNVIMQDQLPVGLRAVIVDISERKTYENHLEKLASIVENSPFAMVEADKEGNLELVNEKAIQLKTLIVNNQESIISQVKGVYETKHKVENRLIFDNIEYNFLYVFNEKLNRVNIFISS